MLAKIYETLFDDQKLSLSIRKRDEKLIISITIDTEDGEKGPPILLKGTLETCVAEFEEAMNLASQSGLDELEDGITKPEKKEEAPAPTKVSAKKAEAPKKEVKEKPLTEEDKIVIASRESIVKGDIDTYIAAIQKLNAFLRKNPKATKVIELRDALRIEKANQEEILQSTPSAPVKGESIDTVEAIATEIENTQQPAAVVKEEDLVIGEDPEFADADEIEEEPEELNNDDPNFEFE